MRATFPFLVLIFFLAASPSVGGEEIVLGEPVVLAKGMDRPRQIVIGDVNRDAYPDIVVRDGVSKQHSVILLENSGPETREWNVVSNRDFLEGPSRSFIFMDYRRDGTPDLVIALWKYVGIYNLNQPSESHVNTFGIQEGGVLKAGDTNRDGTEEIWVSNAQALSYMGDTYSTRPLDVLSLEEELKDFFLMDLDGDGDRDILCVPDNGSLFWAKNDGPTFWSRQSFDFNLAHVSAADVGDIDRDGDEDIAIHRGESEETILILREPGPENPWRLQTLSLSIPGMNSFSLCDLDQDQDLDILYSASQNSRIGWIENIDPETNRWRHRPYPHAIEKAIQVEPCDTDLDGDLDWVTFSPDHSSILLIENLTGSMHASFPQRKIIDNQADGAHAVAAADIDRDGDLDLFAAFFDADQIGWYENKIRDGGREEWAFHSIFDQADGAHHVFAADLDADGDIDAISASEKDHHIRWHENPNSTESQWATYVLSASAATALFVNAADMDRDGDLDVLSASQNDKTVAWYENPRVKKAEWKKHIVSNQSIGPHGLTVHDLNLDGVLDIVVGNAAHNESQLEWFSSGNPLTERWLRRQLLDRWGGIRDVECADMDRDGDGDILLASNGNNMVELWENVDRGEKWNKQRITNKLDSPRNVFAADLDQDGEMEILSASYDDGLIAWYDKKDGFWEQIIIDSSADGAVFVTAADLDRDGYLDVISASDEGDTFAWYPNRPIRDTNPWVLAAMGFISNRTIYEYLLLSLLVLFVLIFFTIRRKMLLLSHTIERSAKEQLSSLEKTAQGLRSLVQASPMGIVSLDRELNVQFWNPAAEMIFGWQEEEVLERPLHFFLGSREEILPLQHIIRSGRNHRVHEIQVKRKDERIIDIHISLSPLMNSDREVQGIMAVVEDITERKNLEKEVLSISNREQEKIGQELHDGLCQHLAGIAIISRVLEQDLERQQLLESGTAHEIYDLLADAVGQARNLAKGLYPVELDRHGLAAALMEYAEHASKMYQVQCRIHIDSSLEIPDADARTHLFRIVQEGVSNAVRHGQADEIEVRLVKENGSLHLSIQDNGGGGVNSTTLERSKGMGLRIMQYRARILNGQFEIRPGPEQGTWVTVRNISL